MTDSTRHTPSPISSNPANNLGAALAAFQGQLPFSSLLLQNQINGLASGLGGITSLSNQDLNVLQQAFQAQQIQQLQNYMLMNSQGSLSGGNGNNAAANAQAQVAAQFLMQNQVSSP